VNWLNTLTKLASDAWRAITGLPGDVERIGQGLWQFVTSVAQVLDFVVSHPFVAVTLALQGLAALLTGNAEAWRNAGDRLAGYIWGTQVAPVQADLRRRLHKAVVYLLGQIFLLARWTARQLYLLRMWTAQQLAAERLARIRGDQAEHRYATDIVAALYQAIEREAASGYRKSAAQRRDLVARVLDLAVVRNPVVRGLVGQVTGIVLDLAEVDNPLLRLLAGFLLRRIIDSLGIDKAIGDLAGQLAGPLLGNPDPKNLPQVIADLSGRTGSLEGMWATFMADGGPQILQAGESWRDITSLLVDAALLGFAVAAATDPAGTAAEMSAATEAIGTATIDALASVLAGR